MGMQVLVSASDDKSVKTWDVRSALTSRTGHCLRTLTAHTGCVTAICCSLFPSHLIKALFSLYQGSVMALLWLD
jgi:WD40 repeat protein